jgi:hypothetical protein
MTMLIPCTRPDCTEHRSKNELLSSLLQILVFRHGETLEDGRRYSLIEFPQDIEALGGEGQLRIESAMSKRGVAFRIFLEIQKEEQSEEGERRGSVGIVAGTDLRAVEALQDNDSAVRAEGDEAGGGAGHGQGSEDSAAVADDGEGAEGEARRSGDGS